MQVSFRTIQLTDGKKRVNGALRARAAVRPALRQGSAFLLGLAGGWAVLYGALMPFGLGLTLGFAEDCFAVGAAGAALGVLARSFGTLTVESVCLLCALGAAVAARWLWPGRFVPAVAAGCGTLVGSAVCFAAGEENGVQTILFCGGDALLDRRVLRGRTLDAVVVDGDRLRARDGGRGEGEGEERGCGGDGSEAVHRSSEVVRPLLGEERYLCVPGSQRT